MKEEDIRKREIFDKYLELVEQDIDTFFADKSSYEMINCPACESKEFKEEFSRADCARFCCSEGSRRCRARRSARLQKPHEPLQRLGQDLALGGVAQPHRAFPARSERHARRARPTRVSSSRRRQKSNESVTPSIFGKR